jgi:hypothetical protein
MRLCGGLHLFQHTSYMGDQIADSEKLGVPQEFARLPLHRMAQFTFQFEH